MNEEDAADQSNSSKDGFVSIMSVTDTAELTREVFDREFESVKGELKRQETLSWNIIMGVPVAFLIAISVIIIDYYKFHGTSISEQNSRIDKLSESYFQIRLKSELQSYLNSYEEDFTELENKIRNLEAQ